MFQLRWSWPWHTQVSHNPLFNQEELTTANPSTRGVMEVFVWPGCQDAYCHVGSGYGCGDGNNTNTHRKWKRSDAKSRYILFRMELAYTRANEVWYDMKILQVECHPLLGFHDQNPSLFFPFLPPISSGLCPGRLTCLYFYTPACLTKFGNGLRSIRRPNDVGPVNQHRMASAKERITSKYFAYHP